MSACALCKNCIDKRRWWNFFSIYKLYCSKNIHHLSGEPLPCVVIRGPHSSPQAECSLFISSDGSVTV